jgi:PGF-CTERM protein
VQLSTNAYTKDQKFTVRVERDNGGVGYPNFTATIVPNAASYAWGAAAGGYTRSVKSDEVDVTVQKGTVTIVAAGDQSYYLGEEIKFSGTNTETKTVYLMISGPNIGAANGAMLATPSTTCADLNTATFTTASVLADNTWSYKWGTANVPLDAGTYTVYAVSAARSKPNVGNATYGTVSIVIKKPFVSATASQSTVAKGDKFDITGTAEGNPSPGVQIWMLGKNYVGPATNNIVQQTVSSDATFKYEVTKSATKDLASGQYFIVVQHPMYNNRLDITYTQATGAVNNLITNGGVGLIVFYLRGTGVLAAVGALQGSDAAEALVNAINSPDIDDTYTKLSILIEEPVINVDKVGDRYVGEKFTITGTTNLAVDDQILVEVVSSSFKPTQKTQSGEFSGATGTVKVVKATDGANKWSLDVDASTFKPDEYIVKAAAVEQDATGTALFNVLEGTRPVATVTTKATTAAPVVTTAVTTAALVTTAAPTKAPTQPGFGALVALIGLGAVALLVVRRH